MRDRPKLTATQRIENFTDAMVEEIMSLSGEELRRKLEEDGEDIDALVGNISAIIERAIDAARRVDPGLRRDDGGGGADV